MTSPILQKTPLNVWHRDNAGKMVEFGGWEMPLQYEDGILREHLATRSAGGLFDVSHMGRFRIRGRGGVRFLQHVLSNNCEALDRYMAQYTLIPDERGGVIDDAFLYRFGSDDFLLVVNAGNRDGDWAYLTGHASKFDDVLMEDETESTAMIALQGPMSGRILSGLIEDGDMPPPLRNRLSETTVFGIRALIARTGYTGEPVGFELFVPAESAERVWAGLMEAGKPHGIVAVGLGARDTLRLEACMPLYGHEFGEDHEGNYIPAFAFPLTAAAVSFSARKGDFVGREPLNRQFEQVKKIRRGAYDGSDILPRRIRPVAILDKGVARRGDEILADGSTAGVVTSGTVVPYWVFEGEGARMTMTGENRRRAIALAYLDAGLPSGQYVAAVVRGRELDSRIVDWHGRSDAPPYFRPMPAVWERPRRSPVEGAGMSKTVNLLEKAVRNHRWRQRECVNLIPSEMTPSPLVRLLQVTDPVGRYAEHKELVAAFDREVFYYQGTDFIAWVEDRLGAEMSAFMGCPLVETRAVSGQMANMTVFSALVDHRNRPNPRVEPERIRMAMTHHISSGGHLSAQPMGALRDYVAKDPVTERFAIVNFPTCRDNPFRTDCEKTARMLEAVRPELLVFGKSMTLHPEPIMAIREMVKDFSPQPLFMYDMAHVLGLLGPGFQEPFKEGVDVVTGSTHKTFFGTQRGVIGAAFDEQTPEYGLWKAIRRRVFPGMVSNHHLGSQLGLLLAAIEMNAFKDEYQKQVLANAKAFARALKEQGLDVLGDPESDYTETHQVIVRVGYAAGCETAQALEQGNIIVNYQAIPDDESFTASSALRLGVSEMTRFGMKEKDFESFAALFADAVEGKCGIAAKVAQFRAEFQDMKFCFQGADIDGFRSSLLQTF